MGRRMLERIGIMRFEELFELSKRTFRRWQQRYEYEGADGLADRRVGRPSPKRAPEDELVRISNCIRSIIRSLRSSTSTRSWSSDTADSWSSTPTVGATFRTLQDRLPKELALAGITTVEAAACRSQRARYARILVRAKIRVHDYPDGTVALFKGPQRLASFPPAAPAPPDDPAGHVLAA